MAERTNNVNRVPPHRPVRAAVLPVAVLAFGVLAAPIWAQTRGPAVSAPVAAAAPASQVLNAAIKTAKASNKNILVHFGASW
jgi:hypothetical protein